MYYKEVVDIISGITTSHKFVNQFGYGEISDVMQPEDNSSPDYPYVFLNPLSITATKNTSVFSFNLICMEQVLNNYTSIIKGQSDCITILNDIISKINLTTTYPTMEVQDGFTFTPFVERMKDDVVGATAVINLIFTSPLDVCNKPF